MEQVSMYMVGLPCPPIPVSLDFTKLIRKHGVLTGEEVKGVKVCSSHDLLAGLIFGAMQRNNKALNEIRKTKQLSITEALLTKLDGLEENDVDGMFSACQTFTAEYILAFDDPNEVSPTLKMHRMDEVMANDHVHFSSCSWSAGQEILFNPDAKKRKSADEFKLLSYKDIIKVHCSRVKSTSDDSVSLANTESQ